MRVKLNKGPNWKQSRSPKMEIGEHSGEKLPKYCGSQSGKLHSMQVTGSAADFFDGQIVFVAAVFDNWRSTAALRQKLAVWTPTLTWTKIRWPSSECAQTGPTLTQLIRGNTQVCSAGTWRCDHWPMSNQLHWGPWYYQSPNSMYLS